MLARGSGVVFPGAQAFAEPARHPIRHDQSYHQKPLVIAWEFVTITPALLD